MATSITCYSNFISLAGPAIMLPVSLSYEVQLLNCLLRVDNEGMSPFLAVVSSGRKELTKWIITKCAELDLDGKTDLDYDLRTSEVIPIPTFSCCTLIRLVWEEAKANTEIH